MLLGYLRIYYKKQELIALHKHMGLLQVFGGVHVTHRFSFLSLFIFCSTCEMIISVSTCEGVVSVLSECTLHMNVFFLCSVNVFSV